jgi:hypothetical protein
MGQNPCLKLYEIVKKRRFGQQALRGASLESLPERFVLEQDCGRFTILKP